MNQPKYSGAYILELARHAIDSCSGIAVILAREILEADHSLSLYNEPDPTLSLAGRIARIAAPSSSGDIQSEGWDA